MFPAIEEISHHHIRHQTSDISDSKTQRAYNSACFPQQKKSAIFTSDISDPETPRAYNSTCFPQ